MPWISRREYEAMVARQEYLVDRLAERRDQVRDLRRAIHKLRSDVGRAVNDAVREAHRPLLTDKQQRPPS